MKTHKLFRLSASAALVLLLGACGGGSDAPTASTASIDTFVTAYNQGMTSVQNLNSTAFLDLFDDAFLDGSYTKAQVVDNLKQDAQVQASNGADLPADSVYPMLTLSNVSVSQCNDASGVCTLTATYVNPASDKTTSTTSVQVRYNSTDRKFRLFGDQKSIES